MKISFIPAKHEVWLRRRLQAGTVRELVLFGLVGGTGAVLYTLLNVLFTKSGVRPSVSIALTLAILVPPVYYCQHRLTFRSGRNHWSAFPRYLGAQLFGNVIAMAFAELVPGLIQAHPTPSFVVIAGLVAVLNYGILKFWAFRHHSAPAA